MDKYIKEIDLVDAIEWDADLAVWTLKDDDLENFPAADVAPVVHGRWIKEVYIDPYGADWTKYRCSLCGRVEIKKEPYCNCGAKMEE